MMDTGTLPHWLPLCLSDPEMDRSCSFRVYVLSSHVQLEFPRRLERIVNERLSKCSYDDDSEITATK